MAAAPRPPRPRFRRSRSFRPSSLRGPDVLGGATLTPMHPNLAASSAATGHVEEAQSESVEPIVIEDSQEQEESGMKDEAEAKEGESPDFTGMLYDEDVCRLLYGIEGDITPGGVKDEVKSKSETPGDDTPEDITTGGVKDEVKSETPGDITTGGVKEEVKDEVKEEEAPSSPWLDPRDFDDFSIRKGTRWTSNHH